MKISILHCSLAWTVCLSLVGISSESIFGQLTPPAHDPVGQASNTSTDGGATTLGSCAQPPCRSLNSGRKYTTLPPGPRAFTAAELEKVRYEQLFSEIAAQEQMANQEEDAGRSEAAASWHGYFAAKSGLTPEEAEIVKKLGAKYRQDSWAWQSKYKQTLLDVRHANPGVRMSRVNSPEIAAVEQEGGRLFPKLKAELIDALGSKSFTRLDSYTLHSHDNSTALIPGQVLPTTGQQSLTPRVNGVK